MEKVKLNYDHPSVNEARYIAEVRKMTPQQRFDKLMAIIELSYVLKNAKKATSRPKDVLDIEELEKINKNSKEE